jgi:hemerythrin-like domain-containing protein
MKIGEPGRQAGFDEPLEMLEACHERIADHCATLARLAVHLPAHGADEQAQQAARNLLRYFDTAGRHHHEDEERDVFPFLLGAAPAAELAGINRIVARLRDDHAAMMAEWLRLRPALVRMAAGDSAALSPAGVDRFCTLYREHMEIEESELLPFARRVIGPEAAARIGHAMAARRGVRP